MSDLDWASDWSQPDDSYSSAVAGTNGYQDIGSEGGARFIIARVGMPAAKRPWDPWRMHGKKPHWDGMKAKVKEKGWMSKPNFRKETLRTNQALVDKTGKIVRDPVTGRTLRPDAQIVDTSGRVHIIEIGESVGKEATKGKKSDYVNLLGNDLGGYWTNYD
ncbi:MAG: hypothetical protein J0L78_07360 [Planctomycetes bacterium]|nr:hypothetical protein [Planctomycetota bacterium]